MIVISEDILRNHTLPGLMYLKQDLESLAPDCEVHLIILQTNRHINLMLVYLMILVVYLSILLVMCGGNVRIIKTILQL